MIYPNTQSNKRTCVIMQPTYLPWLGYFDLMMQADEFVFLDDVQYSKQSWQSRNKIRNKEGSFWLSLPIKKSKESQISNIHINNNINWKEKHIKSIVNCYSKTKHFTDFFPILYEELKETTSHLSILNRRLIYATRKFLEINYHETLSSFIQKPNDKIESLICIVKFCACSEYLSPLGAKDYLDPHIKRFENEGIYVRYQEFDTIKYNQNNYENFIPSLSIIDLIFNLGKEETVNIIKKGRR